MSRKSLVPIQLPRDPTVALEAATKQYVDGRTPVQSLTWANLASFSGTWASYDPGGGGWNPVSYRKIGDVVSVRGLAQSTGPDLIIGTLPVGFRPPRSCLFLLSGQVEGVYYGVRVDIGSGGVINVTSTSPYVAVTYFMYLGLDGISFSVTA